MLNLRRGRQGRFAASLVIGGMGGCGGVTDGSSGDRTGVRGGVGGSGAPRDVLRGATVADDGVGNRPSIHSFRVGVRGTSVGTVIAATAVRHTVGVAGSEPSTAALSH